MKTNDLVSGSHSVSNLMYHLEWCTKYRYGVIDSQKYKTLCEAVLLSIAEEHGMEILEMGVEPEHIHLIVRAPMSMGPSKALQLLKGGSSYRLRKLLPEFKVMYFQGHMWSPGKFARTVGLDEEIARKYVREQSIHHQSGLGAFIAWWREAPPRASASGFPLGRGGGHAMFSNSSLTPCHTGGLRVQNSRLL